MKKVLEAEEISKIPIKVRSNTKIKSYKSNLSSRKKLSNRNIQKQFFPDKDLSTLESKILDFIQGTYFGIFISLVTFYSLFADDIRAVLFPPSADLTFSIINIICITIFFAQMICLSICKEGYFGKFYFWLDIISTISMIFDLVWISNLLTLGQTQSAANIIQITRAGRASKIGARSARLIRIIRLIRLLRLYKNAQATMIQEQNKKISVIKTVRPNNKKNSQILKSQKGAFEYMRQDHIIESDLRASNQDDQVNQGANNPDKFKQIEKLQIKRNKFKLPPLNKKIQKTEIQEELQKQQLQEKLQKEIKQQMIQKVQKNQGTDEKKLQSNTEINQSNSNKKFEMEEFEFPSETKVGAKLKDEIQKNIILMVLVILVSIPMFESTTWYEQLTVYNKAVYELQYFADNSYQPGTIDAQLNNLIQILHSIYSPLVYMYFPVNSTCCTFPDNYSTYVPITTPVASIRTSSLTISSSNNATLIFDTTNSDRFTAQLNIGRTLFVCFLLTISTLLFTRDVENYALQPLQNMINTVKKIIQNPLKAIAQIQNQNLVKSTLKNEIGEKEKTEPVILENMIVKIGALLAIGFGQAGSQIIAKNIQSHGAVNAVLPGKKIMSIFGFCDIRNFTDATEVLQTNVMNFVNQIASIVHGVIHRCAGSANKNIGDAFLLVWKFKQKQTIISETDGQTSISLRKISKVRQTADLAIYAFMKIIAEVSKSSELLKYKNNEKLKARIKNYEGVRMGYGLHVGWAIQGGIGSQFKIDASYLSPNVNMASRLQAATKQFGTPILISGQLADLMTPKNRQYLRKIDRVTVKGSINPIELYTLDTSIRNLLQNTEIKAVTEKLSQFEKKKKKIFINKIRQTLIQKLDSSKKITENLFSDDKDFHYMREPYTQQFFSTWKIGMQNYLAGDWISALRNFKSTYKMLNDIADGPSKTLIDIIQSSRGTAPEDWKGYRELTQK